MDPQSFEEFVAEKLRAEGYRTELTATTSDWGVDIFATRDAERIAVQVKKYRGARPVNRQMGFELYGASRYFDCTGAVIATDGDLRSDARRAAEKLGVRVLAIEWERSHEDLDGRRRVRAVDAATVRERGATFESIWRSSVMPLAGRTLRNERGLANRILEVDWGGVRRVSSTGARSRIPIEPFRWAIETVLEFGEVSRQDINEQYAGRASSGILLILAQVPLFEVVTVRGRSTIRLRQPGA